MKYPKIRELAEAIKALIKGPYTSGFPREPHVPHPNFRGQPKFDATQCVGCLACEEVCPGVSKNEFFDSFFLPVIWTCQ